ncbi:hypothetical protein ACVW17_006816 [Bradyrhizobium sp. USDA 4473]
MPRITSRGDERIAVAVAADPASHRQERGEVAGLAALGVQPVLQRAMQPRHLPQEGVVVERQAVADLVEHGQLGPAQQIGLPQRHDGATKLLVAGLALVRRHLQPLAAVEQVGDLHLAVHRALAADLGRMRGQDRADQRALEEAAQIGRADAGLAGMHQRLLQRARPRRPARAAAAHLADVVLVLGDVGEVGEIAERADDPQRLGDRHAVEDAFQLAPRQLVLVAVEPDRGLADALDQVEHLGPFLVAHGVAEYAPQQADVVPQPCILLLRLHFCRAPVGLGRHRLGRQSLGRQSLGRHGWLLQRLPGSLPSVRFFCRSAR